MVGDSMRRTGTERKLLAQVVARKHLQDRTSFHELGEEFHISERDARALYQMARDEMLVRVTVAPTYSAPPSVDEKLSLAITLHPSMLRKAIVVKVPTAQAPDQDEFLHRQLASVAAQHLLNELHDGDTVAVAGGRGPAFTADAISELTASTRKFQGVQLISACGGSLRRLSRNLSTSGPLDADVVADALALALGSKHSDTKLVLLPLALGDSPALDEVVATVAPHITQEWWQQHRVDICLVGAGVFSTDPDYFLQHHYGTHLEVIGELLSQLEANVLAKEGAGIVADVARQLWITRDVEHADSEEAADLVERINARLVGTGLVSLDRAREKILVAGGEGKYAALRAVVLSARCDFRPTTLITDAVTAHHLYEELQAQTMNR
jgi:DNA-binding transcriptional regulator LsrR (DeoR family)